MEQYSNGKRTTPEEQHSAPTQKKRRRIDNENANGTHMPFKKRHEYIDEWTDQRVCLGHDDEAPSDGTEDAAFNYLRSVR
jgi:hypothetical protein